MSRRVAIAGATGRMGRALIEAVGNSDLTLCAAIARQGDPLIGTDAGALIGGQPLGVPVSHRIPDDALADVLIDFTLPGAVPAHAEMCSERGIAWVLGTTGLDQTQCDARDAAATSVAVCHAANFSTGVTVLLNALASAAEALGDSVDIEIVEAHHRHKVDAPSGTALAMGRVVAEALNRDLDAVAVYGREGHTGARDRSTIGFSTIRAGDVIGDHTVMFAGDGERIEFTHRATSRMAFAIGAVRAARWVAGQAPGLYDMNDVLNRNKEAQ